MGLSFWLVIAAIDGVFFGVTSVVIPDTVASWFGGTLTPFAAVVARVAGSTILGFALLNWWARDAADGDARRAIALGNVVGFALVAVVTAQAAIAGTMNALGWAVTVVNVVIVAGIAYAQFGRAPQTARG